jgi:hypothetical protein
MGAPAWPRHSVREIAPKVTATIDRIRPAPGYRQCRLSATRPSGSPTGPQSRELTSATIGSVRLSSRYGGA